jgi:hypothetical protein
VESPKADGEGDYRQPVSKRKKPANGRKKRRHKVVDGRFAKDGELAKSKLNLDIVPDYLQPDEVVRIEGWEHLPEDGEPEANRP